MEQHREVNFHFARLTAGAPREVLAPLGEALLAVDAQRRGEAIDAPALLRGAWLALARWLIAHAGAGLNGQQQLFLLSGAVADTVALKSPAGERVSVELLPAADYDALLAGLGEDSPPYLLTPQRRMAALANGRLIPLDLEHPGRYRGPQEAAGQPADPRQLAEQLGGQLRRLEEEREALSAAIRALAELLQAERLKSSLKPAQAVQALAAEALKWADDPAALARLKLPADTELGVGAAQQLRRDTDRVLEKLAGAKGRLLASLKQVKSAAAVLSKAKAEDGTTAEELVVLDDKALRLVDKDYATTNGVLVQALINDQQRTAWSASRVLLRENTEKFAEPLAGCYATPARLAQSIAKVDALHPNCFPHDPDGRPLLPPIVIEPGVGQVQWYDDRFILSFVCVEPGRKGSRLSLSPVDLAVLRIYGQFLARGDIYDYRGERISGNFAADYAGEVESKAKVKFAGAEKKMTFVSASEIKDAAGREEAVSDYVEFIFCVANGLAVPKRVTPRRIGVILKYCIIENPENSAVLVLRYLASYDPQVVREILNKLADRDKARVVELIRRAISTDKQLGGRFRNDLKLALKEIMGREFAADAERAGLDGSAPAGAAEGDASGDQPSTGEHDYFDV